MQSMSVGDGEIGYRRAGDGPPLVLLHGAVCDSRVGRLTLASLADEFDVIAGDTPGCGASSDLPPGPQMADYADRLADFMVAPDLERAAVVGHSWGSCPRSVRRPPERWPKPWPSPT